MGEVGKQALQVCIITIVHFIF